MFKKLYMQKWTLKKKDFNAPPPLHKREMFPSGDRTVQGGKAFSVRCTHLPPLSHRLLSNQGAE